MITTGLRAAESTRQGFALKSMVRSTAFRRNGPWRRIASRLSPEGVTTKTATRHASRPRVELAVYLLQP